ncbi:senescence-associated protein-domain-containing protein [Auriculariales sp. MPI-PUGE-AT-0066]|nr:senescence-associated protein-domain-containing protein [Auriculariales sp. MPI-PUGE-AT-0066]
MVLDLSGLACGTLAGQMNASCTAASSDASALSARYLSTFSPRSSMADASGYLLLTVPDCRIDSGGQIYTGQLALECVTIAPGASNDSNERDIWLILRLGAFEMAIPPVEPIQHDRVNGVYTVPGQPPAVVRLPPAPPNSPVLADLETFEVLLAQYGVVHEQGGGAPAGFGRLVLIDETDGHIVGEVGQEFAVRENLALNLELPEYGQPQEIHIHAVLPEERDTLLRGAHALSRGIIMATNALSTGMHSASSKFVSSTTPRETPVVFSERTKQNVRRVHKVSGAAVKVTAKTTGVIFKAIDHVAHYIAGSSRAPSPAPTHTNYGYAYGAPPPLPPREKAATYAAAPSPTPSGQGSYFPSQPGSVPYAVYAEPAKSATLAPLDTRAPPVLPSRQGTFGGAPSPSHSYLSPVPMSPQPQGMPPPLPSRKPRLLNRLLMASDLLITTVEESGKHLLAVGTTSMSQSMGHRYGKDVGDAVQLGGDSMRNVAMVYIDARGVGHRALLRRAGKGMIKARFGGGKEVVFGAPPALPPR